MPKKLLSIEIDGEKFVIPSAQGEHAEEDLGVKSINVDGLTISKNDDDDFVVGLADAESEAKVIFNTPVEFNDEVDAQNIQEELDKKSRHCRWCCAK